MSNHFSAANLQHPGDDPRLDLTDLFVFAAPGNPGRTVLIMDSNPTSAPPPIPAPVKNRKTAKLQKFQEKAVRNAATR